MGSITIFSVNSPCLSEVLYRRLHYGVLSQTVATNAEEVRGDQRVLNPHCGTLFSIGPLGRVISLELVRSDPESTETFANVWMNGKATVIINCGSLDKELEIRIFTSPEREAE